MNTLSYKEASSLLGISVDTLKQAIGRGVITSIPSTHKTKYLMKEQVELFKGKRLSTDDLTPQEKTAWEGYKLAILYPNATTPIQVEPFQATTVEGKFYLDPETTKALLLNYLSNGGNAQVVLTRGSI